MPNIRTYSAMKSFRSDVSVKNERSNCFTSLIPSWCTLGLNQARDTRVGYDALGSPHSSHAPIPAYTTQPRLSATAFSHVFRRAIRIENVMLLATAIFPASELLTDTVILDLVDDVIDRHERLVADVHPHIGNRRHGINTSILKRSKPFHSRRDLLQDTDIPSHAP